MKTEKFDSMFFVGIIMAFGTIIAFLVLEQPMTIGTQLAFVSGLGLGILGMWIVMQNAQKIMRQTMPLPEKRTKANQTREVI